MKFRHWLTWKRGDQLIQNWTIGTFPLFVSLGIGTAFSIPLPTAGVSSDLILVIGIVASLISFLGVVYFTKSAGITLYFPPLHSWSGIMISTSSLELIAVILTYVAYILFAVPLGKPIVPSTLNISMGIALASIYALFLGAYRSRIAQKRQPVHDSDAGRQICQSLREIRSDNPKISNTNQLINGLESLADEYKKEPLMDNSCTEEIIRTWCNESSQSKTLVSRLRMIPKTGKEPTSERTKEQITRFRRIENDLRAMDVVN